MAKNTPSVPPSTHRLRRKEVLHRIGQRDSLRNGSGLWYPHEGGTKSDGKGVLRVGIQFHRQQCHPDQHAAQMVEARHRIDRSCSGQETSGRQLPDYQEVHPKKVGR